MAFRVQCSRNTPGEIRIAAAGFDHANELFLGPNALRWSTQAEGGPAGAVDGGITVGLYVWKPKTVVQEADTASGEWYEISALGEVYHLRAAGKRGQKAVDVDNLLTEGWYPTALYIDLLLVSLSMPTPCCYSPLFHHPKIQQNTSLQKLYQPVSRK